MNIISVCAFAILSLCVIMLIRQLRPELVPAAVALIGVLLLGYLLLEMVPVIKFIRDAANQSGFGGYFELLIKSLAIALACQLSAEVCRDCGETALAGKVELAGKISIIILSLPVLQQLLNMAKDLMG